MTKAHLLSLVLLLIGCSDNTTSPDLNNNLPSIEISPDSTINLELAENQEPGVSYYILADSLEEKVAQDSIFLRFNASFDQDTVRVWTENRRADEFVITTDHRIGRAKKVTKQIGHKGITFELKNGVKFNLPNARWYRFVYVDYDPWEIKYKIHLTNEGRGYL